MRLLSALLLGTTLLCQTANAQITSKQEVLDKITQVLREQKRIMKVAENNA